MSRLIGTISRTKCVNRWQLVVTFWFNWRNIEAICTVTEFVSERGFLEVTGLPYDAYQAEISTSSETMKCSIFDYPIEVYGVTGGLVKDNIITCGGRGFKTFYGKLKITLLDPKSTVFHQNLNFKHICDKSHFAQRIQQLIPKL